MRKKEDVEGKELQEEEQGEEGVQEKEVRGGMVPKPVANIVN